MGNKTRPLLAGLKCSRLIRLGVYGRHTESLSRIARLTSSLISVGF